MGGHLLYIIFSSSFFIAKMLNYFLQVIGHYINDKKVHPLTFYIELSSKSVGVGLNVSLLKDN